MEHPHGLEELWRQTHRFFDYIYRSYHGRELYIIDYTIKKPQNSTSSLKSRRVFLGNDGSRFVEVMDDEIVEEFSQHGEYIVPEHGTLINRRRFLHALSKFEVWNGWGLEHFLEHCALRTLRFEEGGSEN